MEFCCRFVLDIDSPYVIMENYYTEEERYWTTGGNTGTLPDRITPSKLYDLGNHGIFCFGSNFEGRHMGGAAKAAVEQFGAVWGIGEGLQGRSYAIPTMEGLENMKPAIERFTSFARQHQELRFYVTAIGCGIAGYKPEEVAPFFLEAAYLKNVYLPLSFWKIILDSKTSDPDIRAIADNFVGLFRGMHKDNSLGLWNDGVKRTLFNSLDRHQMWEVGLIVGAIMPYEEEPGTYGLPEQVKERIWDKLQTL